MIGEIWCIEIVETHSQGGGSHSQGGHGDIPMYIITHAHAQVH